MEGTSVQMYRLCVVKDYHNGGSFNNYFYTSEFTEQLAFSKILLFLLAAHKQNHKYKRAQVIYHVIKTTT